MGIKKKQRAAHQTVLQHLDVNKGMVQEGDNKFLDICVIYSEHHML